jgi:hypothetical protein
MDFSKEKEILKFARWFLNSHSERCIQECGKIVTSLQFPVFKKFLSCRVKRELQFYRLCLDTTSVLTEAGCRACERDIGEIVEASIDLDDRLRRDMKLLPIRIHFDYNKILPLRKERARKQLNLFIRLFSIDDVCNYNGMVRTAFRKEEFLEIKNEILELYVEEAFIINSSISSRVKTGIDELAQRMYCSMLDVGIGLNREITDKIYSA